MSYLDPATKARIQAQIATKEAQLTAANTAYDEALRNSEVQSYMLDTGEGKQATTRRKPAEIYTQIKQLESDLNRLYRRLGGTGIVSVTLRRYP